MQPVDTIPGALPASFVLLRSALPYWMSKPSALVAQSDPSGQHLDFSYGSMISIRRRSRMSQPMVLSLNPIAMLPVGPKSTQSTCPNRSAGTAASSLHVPRISMTPARAIAVVPSR